MDNQTLLNIVYDVLAQNPVKGAYGYMGRELVMVTDLIDHVDTERETIVFKGKNGREVELRLVATYAPSSAVAKAGTL